VNTTQSKHEDSAFYRQIEDLAGVDLAKFEAVLLLKCNGTEKIVSAETATIAGKTVLVVAHQFRRGFFRLTGSGAAIHRGKPEVGFIIMAPRGWVRVEPGRWRQSRKSGYYREWKPSYQSIGVATKELALERYQAPESKWVNRKDWLLQDHTERRVRAPKGFAVK
jgi:hypothetical protein